MIRWRDGGRGKRRESNLHQGPPWEETLLSSPSLSLLQVRALKFARFTIIPQGSTPRMNSDLVWLHCSPSSLSYKRKSFKIHLLFLCFPRFVLLSVLPDSRSFLTQAICWFSQAKYRGVPRWPMLWSKSPPWAARDSMHFRWPAAQSNRK